MKVLAVVAYVVFAVGCTAERRQLTTSDPHNPDAPVAEAQRSTALDAEPPVVEDAATVGPRKAHDHSEPAQDAGAAVYSCPMHPEVRESSPTARCPKCGMKLENVEPPAVVYTCPMHPEVQESSPAARCPKCHMKLEPRK